jgi:hypothetical protein
MSDSVDVRLVIEEAERAAAAGDFRTAELFLRDAAARQEESLGPFHPDIANTLNNLAVVYETLQQPSRAERCYRRAYAIALAALEPNHPFVAISEKNYRDFCNSRGIPFEPPRALSPVESTGSDESLKFVETLNTEESSVSDEPLRSLESLGSREPISSEEPLSSEEPFGSPEPLSSPEPPGSQEPWHSPEPPRAVEPPVSSEPARRAPAVLMALGVLALIGGVLWLRSKDPGDTQRVPSAAIETLPEKTERPAPPRQPESGVAESAPIAAEKPATVAPQPARGNERPVESAGGGRASAPSTPAPPVKPPAAAKPSSIVASATPEVEDASLCRELTNWRCRNAGNSIESGAVFFYTRVKSDVPLTIEHRWYRNSRLERIVPLRIQPNDRSGFRTFSRTAVKPGDWRVELRVRDGGVLHTEDFTVR